MRPTLHPAGTAIPAMRVVDECRRYIEALNAAPRSYKARALLGWEHYGRLKVLMRDLPRPDEVEK